MTDGHFLIKKGFKSKYEFIKIDYLSRSTASKI